MNFKVKSYLLLMAIVLIWAACRKTDNQQTANNQTTPSVNETRFFGEHRSSNPQVEAISQWIKQQNDKKNFVTQTVKQIGYPRWDKALIKSTGQNLSHRGGVDSSFTIFLIPFVRDSQNYVNASLILKATQTDTTMGYICDWQYSDFGYSQLSDTAIRARNVFHLFTLLDNNTFGYKNFKVNDKRLYTHQDSLAILNSNIPIDSAEVVYSIDSSGISGRQQSWSYEVCTNYTICVHLGEGNKIKTSVSGRGNSLPGGCVTTATWTYCTVIEVLEPGDLPTGGGTGINGTGSGGSGGGSTPPPSPCPTATTGNRGNIYENCGPGWVPIIDNPSEPLTIFSNLTNPLNLPDSSFVNYGFSILELNDTFPTGRLIAKAKSRNNIEDMTCGYDHDTTDIDINLLGTPPNTDTGYLFGQMANLFFLCSIFDQELQTVGASMIQRFNENTGLQFTSPILNHKVFEAGKFKDFANNVVKQIDDSLKTNGENINTIQIDSLPVRPYFNGLYHKFHGLQILINDTEETDVFIDNFSQDPVSHTWEADISFTIKDHFGLDKMDVLTYQYSHTGFLAWWWLQHRKNYKPFETIIKIKIHVTVPR